VTKLSLLFMIATMTACPWPKPVEPPTTEAPEFHAVHSSHGATFVQSRDESFVLFKGGTDIESKKAAFDDLVNQYQACQGSPCGKPLPAATIQEINDTFANQTEWLGQLGNHEVWVSGTGGSFLLRFSSKLSLPEIDSDMREVLQCPQKDSNCEGDILGAIVPCLPGDCGPDGPIPPPWGDDWISRPFEAIRQLLVRAR
jgi:hypothetical protein